MQCFAAEARSPDFAGLTERWRFTAEKASKFLRRWRKRDVALYEGAGLKYLVSYDDGRVTDVLELPEGASEVKGRYTWRGAVYFEARTPMRRVCYRAEGAAHKAFSALGRELASRKAHAAEHAQLPPEWAARERVGEGASGAVWRCEPPELGACGVYSYVTPVVIGSG